VCVDDDGAAVDFDDRPWCEGVSLALTANAWLTAQIIGAGNRSFEKTTTYCMYICTTAHSNGRLCICGCCGYAEETGRRPVEENPRSSKTAWPGLHSRHHDMMMS
jgi:hypothetical protein